MAVLAGMDLEYYYRVFEKQKQPSIYGRKISSQMKLLMTVATTILDKRKISTEPEKILPIRIKEYLDSRMTGQEEAKKIIAMSIYRFMKYGERKVIMLEGSTGVGKTFLFENLSECDFLNKELTFYSHTATQLTPNGFVGDSIDNMLQGFKKACDYRYINDHRVTKESDKGIIFIDEIDKLFLPNKDYSGEDVNQTVLSQLLTVMAGTADIADVKTSNILFILAGAFEHIDIIRENRKKKAQMGFASQELFQGGIPEKNNLRNELLQTGASRQFIARISHFVHMETINRRQMKYILVNRENGLLTQRAELLRKDGLILQIENDEVIERMLDVIMESKAGVRGVKEMLENIISFYDYEMIEKGYKIMIIHTGVLNGVPPRLEKEKVQDENIIRFHKCS